MASYFNEDLWYGSSAEKEAEAEQKAAKSIAAKVGRILGAKPFPIAAQRLSELTKDPYCPMQVVVEVLESDPALSARLLRLVNSAGYALRTACTSVAHAAALVGIRKLNQVASTAAILDLYESHSEVAAATLEHAAIVGALSRYLAAHVGLPQDELFTCGFLHDIGKLMLLDSEGEEYAKILKAGVDEPDTVHVQERALLGYDHALLGGHVLAAWRIPSPVPKVVAWHHQVARAYQEGPEIGRMVSVVRLADAMSVALFRQFPDFEVERLARTEAASYLEISEPQIAAMWDEMFLLAQRARASFRGEPSREVAASLPADSIRPANDVTADAPPESVPAAHKQPKYFPCVVCGVPSYANLCKACNGYVCPSHQDAEDEWCAICTREYAALELRLPAWLYAVLGSAIGAMLVGTLVGAAGAVTGRSLKVMVAPGLLSLLTVVLLWAWQRFFRRLWFLRTCPNRKSFAPALGDAGQPDAHESAVLSKRWIRPFDLDGHGGVVREIQEELELPAARRGSSNPPKSERRVSLRPSKRGATDLERPILASLTPQSANPRIHFADEATPLEVEAALSAPEPSASLPTARPTKPAAKRRAKTEKPAAVSVEPANEPSAERSTQGRTSKRAAAPSKAPAAEPKKSRRPTSKKSEASAAPAVRKAAPRASKRAAASPKASTAPKTDKSAASPRASLRPSVNAPRSSFRPPGNDVPPQFDDFEDFTPDPPARRASFPPPAETTSASSRAPRSAGRRAAEPNAAAQPLESSPVSSRQGAKSRRSRAATQEENSNLAEHPLAAVMAAPSVQSESVSPKSSTPARRSRSARRDAMPPAEVTAPSDVAPTDDSKPESPAETLPAGQPKASGARATAEVKEETERALARLQDTNDGW